MDEAILYQMYEMMTEMEARFEEAKNDTDFMLQVEAFREELKSKGFEGTDEELDGFIIWLSVAKGMEEEKLVCGEARGNC